MSHVTRAIPHAPTNKSYMSREPCLGLTNSVSSCVMYMSYVCVCAHSCACPPECGKTRCSVLQCVGVGTSSSVLHYVALCCANQVCCSALQCVALCCSVLHCVVLIKCVAVRGSVMRIHHPVRQYAVLLHTCIIYIYIPVVMRDDLSPSMFSTSSHVHV